MSRQTESGDMLFQFQIAGDLAGLLTAYLDQEQLDLPDLRAKLARYKPNSRMSFIDWWSYLELLRDHCDKPHIGLEIGKCIQPAHCGVLGYLSLSCDTLLEALQRFTRYETLLYEGGQVQAEVIEGRTIRATWPSNFGISTRESDDVLMAGLLSYTRMLAGEPSLAPTRIGYMHSLPVDLTEYKGFLNCELEFNQPYTFIEFEVKHLSLPISHADSALCRLLEQQAESQLSVIPSTGEFEKELYMHLVRSMQDGNPTIEDVAKKMSMSSRTLHRRLNDKNLSFKGLLQRTREKLAQQYLREKRLTLSEIALLLGYSEHSAFTRAYKQWTGETPLQYQKSALRS